MVDVDLIDARGVHGGDRPGDAMFANSFRQNFPAVGEQELANPAARGYGIRDARITAAATAGPNREPRPTSSTPGHHLGAQRPCPLFKFQRAAQPLKVGSSRPMEKAILF